MAENISKDLKMIYRNVLWREVVRSYAKKGKKDVRELTRAHVNLQLEVVDELGLSSKVNAVTFIMRQNSKYVTLTRRSFDTHHKNDLNNDPQFLLEDLLAEVMFLKYKKAELVEKLDRGEIEDHHF